MPYPIAALFVLAVFYGIYFAKKHCTLIVLSIQKRDCSLLLFPAAVNLNVLPGNIACVVTRKKAYQVCVFHIAACSSYKGKLARLGIAYVIVIRGTYTSRRNAVYQYSLIRHLFGKRPCERNKRCFTLEIHNLPFLINNFY